MTFDPRYHHRRSIRLRDYDYSACGGYFITMVVHRRRSILGRVSDGDILLSPSGNIVLDVWLEIEDRYPQVRLDEFVIMPDHIHGIIMIVDNQSAAPSPPCSPEEYRISRRRMVLPKIIGYFKMNTSKRVNALVGSGGRHLWQTNYWERIIRDKRELRNVRNYIRNNPIKWMNAHGAIDTLPP
ncbi:MAG: transposase [Bacteroidota bacterium]